MSIPLPRIILCTRCLYLIKSDKYDYYFWMIIWLRKKCKKKRSSENVSNYSKVPTQFILYIIIIIIIGK